MPRKKGTLEKVTEVVAGVDETVISVSETVEGIAGTVSEVARVIKEKMKKSPRQEASKQPKSALAAREKPQAKPTRLSTGKKQPSKRQTTKKR